MLKNKAIATLLVVFLVFSFYGKGILSNIVLCIDSCGHIALEFFHYDPQFYSLTPESDNMHCHSETETSIKDFGCSSCYDIPLSTNFLDQNISTVRYESHKIKLDPISTKDSVSPYKRPYGNGFLTELTSSITSNLTSLKTTILLI